MAEGSRNPGGLPVFAEQPVTVDEVTVTGNGTPAHPLEVIGGSLAVAVDDTTIGGDGKVADPLHVIPLGLADQVPVLTDGITCVGDGTTALPITVITGGGGGAVVADGVTIGGFGTVAVPLHAIFAGFDDNVAVAVDGTTIAGTGKTASSLHVVPAGLDDKVAVLSDGTTISGTGKTGSALHVDPAGLAGLVAVDHDGTLSGDGTSGSPLSVISGAGTPRAFSYTVLGTEPDLANLVIPLPAVRGSNAYLVWPQMQAGTNFFGMPMVKSKTTSQFVLALSANATAGDVFAFYLVDAF